MKKILLSLMVVIGVIACISVFNTIEGTYTRNGEVINVSHGIVTVKDNNGFLWELETDELKKGQRVCLTMHDNHTNNIITDDIIVKYEII